jgi:hypothetical protein
MNLPDQARAGLEDAFMRVLRARGIGPVQPLRNDDDTLRNTQTATTTDGDRVQPAA